MQCKMVGMLFVALLVQCMQGHVSALIYFKMFPKYDQFILAGTRFQLNCTMKQYGTDVAEVYEVTKIKILKGTQELPTDVRFNYYQEDRTLALTIPNVTLEHDGTYNCYYGNNSTIETFKPVHVGEPPGKPQNIVCVSNNLNDFRCSFTLSKKSTNIPMRWIMEYRLSGDLSNATVNCSTASDLVISCEPCPPAVVIKFASYEILIYGVNHDFELQVNESFTVKLNQSIVRPDPVATLRVELTNVSSEAKLLWGFPKGLPMEIFYMQYKIVITSDWDTRTLYAEGNKKHEEYLLTKLVPYTNYRVTVEAKSMEAVGDIYWSTKNVVDFWTDSDICEHTVCMTPGSYMVVDCEQEMCAVLFWKNPARKDWNGNITGYRVIVQTVKLAEYNVAMANNHEEMNLEDQPIYRYRRVTKPWLENLTGIAVSGALKTKLYKTDNYSMRMMVINTAGISMTYFEIVIPSLDKGETLKVEWVSVEMANSSVHISWNMDPENCDAVRSVTYYWGLVDTIMNEYTVYKEEIDWVTFDISDGCGMQTSQQIEKVLYQSNTRYAVSVGTGQISGGMVLETFRFNKHNVADMPQYTAAADRDKLQVHILYSDYYVSEGGRPEQYQIVYSEDSESEDCPIGGYNKTFPADFANPVFEISDLNLKSDAQYKVCVAAINTAGMGRYGKPVIAKTPEDNSAAIMVIAIVIPITMILLVVFVIWLCCRCRRSFQKLKIDTTITIPLPDDIKMDGTYTEITAQKTNENKLSDDHDSGKGSDSPASSSSDINQQQQDGVRVSMKTSSCNVSTVSTEDCVHGPDPSRKRSISPALSGYLKVVQRNSSNSEYVVEYSDHENNSLIDGVEVSSERNVAIKNRGKRIYNTIDGHLSCSSNSDEELNVITKANTKTNAIFAAGTAQVPIVGKIGGSREPQNEYDDDTQMLRNINNSLGNALVPHKNEHLPNNANNTMDNAMLPNINEYLPNGNDQEIRRSIAGVTNLPQETPNSNLVYVDEHDPRKVPTNVKAYVLNEAEQLANMSHFYMEMEDAVSDKQEIKQISIADINQNEDVFNVNPRQSHAAEVQLHDSQLEEKTDENVETSSVNSQKCIQENNKCVMISDQQSKYNLNDKARLPNRRFVKQEAIDTNNDTLQSYASHDYQTHPKYKVKADEYNISDYVEAKTSDTFEYDQDITNEETEEIKEPSAQCLVITDFEKNLSIEETSEGKVNTEYNGNVVNGVNRSFQEANSSSDDQNIVSILDNFYEISNINHYRSPDEISLGQGSTISDVSDTTSIKSSEFMNGRSGGTLSPDQVSLIEAPVPEVCKDIQDFVEVEDVVDEGNGNKMEVEHSVENDKTIGVKVKHSEVGDHNEKSKVNCSVESGDGGHGESFSSESSKYTSGTGNVVSYMKTGLESATDGIQEFNLQNTEISDRKERKDTSLKNASPEHAGNALDSNSAIRNDIQITPL